MSQDVVSSEFPYRVGVIQMNSQFDPKANFIALDQALAYCRQQGVRLAMTPENTLMLSSHEDYLSLAEPLGEGPWQAALSALAKRYQLWLAVGSLPIRFDDHVATCSLVFDRDGNLKAHYAKLHLFDVDVADGYGTYRESTLFQAGDQIVVTDTPLSPLGLSICYDVRFPHLYSQLRQQGACLLNIPAAFTRVTGEAHWQTLLQARAIETQCFVIAAAQCGTHQSRVNSAKHRETWGHSMIIDPWGRILAQAGDHPDILIQDLDLTVLEQVRSRMPVEQHARFTSQWRETT